MKLPLKLVVLAVVAAGLVGCAKRPPDQPLIPRLLRTATIVLYQKGGTGCVARTAPQRVLLDRLRDDIEWTVVNLCNVDASTLEIVLPGTEAESPLQPGPNDKGPRLPVGGDRMRRSVKPNAAIKVYKYQIFLNGTMIEDPELEIMP